MTETASPLVPPVPPRPRTSAMRYGLLLMLASGAVGFLVPALGLHYSIGLFLTVIIGILSGFYTFDENGVIMLGGIFLISACGLFVFVGQDERLLGWSTDAIAVADAPSKTSTSSFTFVDAHVERTMRGYAVIRGRGSAPLTRVAVAPLVPRGWSKADAIPAWVASAPYELDQTIDRWSAPWNAGIRLYDWNETYPAAVRSAENKFGLRSAPGAPILRWVPSRQAAVMAALTRLAIIEGVCAVVWLLLFGGTLVYERLRPASSSSAAS